MKLNRVILTFKKALYKSQPALFGGLVRALESKGIDVKIRERKKLECGHNAGLIISVGGDGTVLAAAHVAGQTPILGVNFMPKSSVGFFCAATADNFETMLDEIVGGKIRPTALPMLEASIDGKKLDIRALNDALFASTSPAEMSRYILRIGGCSEDQRSSGVWIAAGPGSTAGIASAGGKRLPITTSRLEFLVREPCPMPGKRYRLKGDVLPPGAKIEIVSSMENARVYLDGPAHVFPLPKGSHLTIRVIPKAVKMYLP